MASPASTIPDSARPIQQPAAPGRRGRADVQSRALLSITAASYWGIHAACFLAFFTGVNAVDLALCAGFFWLRMFGITGGYHRYFSHKTYRTSRAFQFVLALLGASSLQKGPLWWSAGHRRHHRYSDQPGDMHSPRDGFWWSHQAWIMSERWERTEIESIPDFAKYPELMWLNRFHALPAIVVAVVCALIGGFSGVVWGFAISTTLLWHSTYSINSLAHRWGSQRYDTGDDSRNNLFLALLTMGEGWHNNHHYYQASTRQGFFWWEIDLTYYALRGLSKLGLVWDLREPPERVLRGDEAEAPLRRAA